MLVSLKIYSISHTTHCHCTASGKWCTNRTGGHFITHTHTQSHFILSGFKYYVLTSKNKYNVLIVLRLYCKTLLLLLRSDNVTVRLGTGVCGMGRYKGGLRCKGRVNIN